MNKKTVLELFQAEVARFQKNIANVENLDTKKIYKISYCVWGHIKDPVTGRYSRSIAETCTFIGKIKGFNKESIRFIALGIQKVKGTQFQNTLRENPTSKKFEVPLSYDSIYSFEEWENLETPQLEAAFLVNYEFVSQKMRHKCFNY